MRTLGLWMKPRVSSNLRATRRTSREFPLTEFTLQLLQAINDWQRGGDHKQKVKRGAKLKQFAAGLPEKFRTCSATCYRQEAHEKEFGSSSPIAPCPRRLLHGLSISPSRGTSRMVFRRTGFEVSFS